MGEKCIGVISSSSNTTITAMTPSSAANIAMPFDVVTSVLHAELSPGHIQEHDGRGPSDGSHPDLNLLGFPTPISTSILKTVSKPVKASSQHVRCCIGRYAPISQRVWGPFIRSRAPPTEKIHEMQGPKYDECTAAEQ